MRHLYLIRHATPSIRPEMPAREWTLSERGIQEAQVLAGTAEAWGLEARDVDRPYSIFTELRRYPSALRAYWGPALTALSDLHFDSIEVFTGFDALTVLYESRGRGRVTETFEFGADGKVVRSAACYAG